jgi:hypothetical protein
VCGAVIRPWPSVPKGPTVTGVGLLDDHNPYPGRSSLRAFEPSAGGGKRWAIAALVSGLLWLFGFGSLFAIAGGAWARTELRDSGASTALANWAVVVGVVGLAVTVVLVLA